MRCPSREREVKIGFKTEKAKDEKDLERREREERVRQRRKKREKSAGNSIPKMCGDFLLLYR